MHSDAHTPLEASAAESTFYFYAGNRMKVREFAGFAAQGMCMIVCTQGEERWRDEFVGMSYRGAGPH